MVRAHGKSKASRAKGECARVVGVDAAGKTPLGASSFAGFVFIPERQVQDYTAISQQVGYERHTVGKWFSQYGQKGLAACQALEMGKKSGSLISGQALAELQEKLSNAHDYFTSYKQIQQWLQETPGIKLSYAHVHRFVRYYLKAKLQVVRKSNLQKDAGYEDKYKKN